MLYCLSEKEGSLSSMSQADTEIRTLIHYNENDDCRRHERVKREPENQRSQKHEGFKDDYTARTFLSVLSKDRETETTEKTTRMT
jgi:hypothetical protein